MANDNKETPKTTNHDAKNRDWLAEAAKRKEEKKKKQQESDKK